EDADRFLFALHYFFGIDVPAAQVGEAADDANDLAKLIRPLPRDGERRDRAAAGAANAVLLGVGGDVVILFQNGQQLVDDDARVFVVELVVFGRPVGVAVAPVLGCGLGLIWAPAGVDEDRDHHRNLAAMNQVVQHVWRADISIGINES